MTKLSRELLIISMRLEGIMETFEYDQVDEEFVDYLTESVTNLKAASKRLSTLKRLHEKQEGDL